MGLFEELEKEMASDGTESEGIAHSITRAMLGNEVVERSKVQAETKRKRQVALDLLGFLVGVVLLLCLAAVLIGGTVALYMWWF